MGHVQFEQQSWSTGAIPSSIAKDRLYRLGCSNKAKTIKLLLQAIEPFMETKNAPGDEIERTFAFDHG